MNYKIATLDEVVNQMALDRPLYVDFETDGLYNEIILAQFYQTTFDCPMIVQLPDPSRILNIMLSAKINVAHNVSYELSTLQNNLGNYIDKRLVNQIKFDDTMLLSRYALPELDSYSFDTVIEAVKGFDPYKSLEEDKKAFQKFSWKKLRDLDLTQEHTFKQGKVKFTSYDLLDYASYDVKFLPDVYKYCHKFEQEMEYRLDKETIRHIHKFQLNGIPVDQQKLAKKVGEISYSDGLINLSFNVNSPKQVTKALGIESSSKEALTEELARSTGDRATTIECILKKRKYSKQLNFLEKYSKDYVTGFFAPVTRSGRTKSAEQNLQQIPRELKCVFGTKEGSKLIYCDWSNLEMRTIVGITGERNMLKIFKDEGDLHNYTAEKIFGQDFTKEQRTIAKIANFSLLYGAGSRTLAKMLQVQAGITLSDVEAQEIKETWLDTYPDIARWQYDSSAEYNKEGIGQLVTGRKFKANTYNEMLNIPNQALGASASKLALVKMLNRIGNDAKLCNYVHDSYLFTLDRYEEFVATTIIKCMKEAWKYYTKFMKVEVPMPIEVVLGTNWGDLEAGNHIMKWEEK